MIDIADNVTHMLPVTGPMRLRFPMMPVLI